MQREFIEFKTKDGLTLPGLLYGNPKNKEVLIYLHGNGSSSVFYNQKKKIMIAEELGKKEVSALFFNNRGANISNRLAVRKSGKQIGWKLCGMAHEKTKECIEDIDGSVSFLKKLGFKKFYLAGSSTGANKICVYNFYKKKNNLISKYLLLAPGDDTGIYYDILGKAKFGKLLKKAKEMIRKKRGKEIIHDEAFTWEMFSWQGFYDIANPDGDYNTFPFLEALGKIKLSKKKLFRHYKSIKKPSIVIYGSEDEYAWGDVGRMVDILKEQNPSLDYKTIKGADHGFTERERQLAKTIAEWL